MSTKFEFDLYSYCFHRAASSAIAKRREGECWQARSLRYETRLLNQKLRIALRGLRRSRHRASLPARDSAANIRRIIIATVADPIAAPLSAGICIPAQWHHIRIIRIMRRRRRRQQQQQQQQQHHRLWTLRTIHARVATGHFQNGTEKWL